MGDWTQKGPANVPVAINRFCHLSFKKTRFQYLQMRLGPLLLWADPPSVIELGHEGNLMDVETVRWQKAIAEAVVAEREECAKLVDQRRKAADMQRLVCLGTKEDLKAIGWKSRAIEAEEIATAIRLRPVPIIQSS